mgnify:CR=1 FL=1
MEFKKHFDLTPTDLDITESSLRKDMADLTEFFIGGEPDTAQYDKAKVNSIRSLLGKLHNQKIWHPGKGELARAPKG